jgi:hypothetical protein
MRSQWIPRGAAPLLVMLALFFAAALVTGEATAQAAPEAELDPVTRAERLSREGVEAYTAGRFKDAIAAMLEARGILSEHGQPPAPELLYNIARIYHKMGERRLAHESYTRFILVDGADPAMVRKALDYREQVAKAETTPVVAPIAPIPGADAPAAGPQTTAPPLKAKASKGSGRSVAYWVGGSGLVILAGGAVLGGLAWSADAGLADETSYSAKRDAQDRGQTLALAADISMITGLAVLTTATVLWFVADDGDSEPGQAFMVAPMAFPGDQGGLGASLSGSF